MNISHQILSKSARATRVGGLLLLATHGIVQVEGNLDSAGLLPPGYSLETVSIPEAINLEIGGLDVRGDGSIVMTTRGGEIWQHDPAGQDWQRLAYGLYYPLGVRIDHETGDLVVAQMTELTRLSDDTGDGHINLSLTLADQWGLTDNYHEYAFGPVRDNDGNFYLTLNLAHAEGVQGSTMGRTAHYRGWAVKVTPDGEFVPYASGLRSPAGIGINKDDEIFVTDNEGDWVATSFLAHLQKGKFYGHPASLTDHSRFEDRDLEAISKEEFKEFRTRAAVYFPHLAMAQSPGEPLFDETGGAFGPFEGQIFVGDQTRSKVMRVSLEKVNGEYQGAVFDFAQELDSGVLRQAFSPDGQTMWVGQTQRGWNSLGGVPFSLQKIVYDGATIPFEMKSIHVKNDGFEIVFTKPVDRQLASETDNYNITHWTYHYHSDYGSPYVDEQPLEITSATVSDDGLRLRLTSPETLPIERVYEIALSNIDGHEGEPLTNDTGYYTLNSLPAE